VVLQYFNLTVIFFELLVFGHMYEGLKGQLAALLRAGRLTQVYSNTLLLF
jgi:hypothetical protein